MYRGQAVMTCGQHVRSVMAGRVGQLGGRYSGEHGTNECRCLLAFFSGVLLSAPSRVVDAQSCAPPDVWCAYQERACMRGWRGRMELCKQTRHTQYSHFNAQHTRMMLWRVITHTTHSICDGGDQAYAYQACPSFLACLTTCALGSQPRAHIRLTERSLPLIHQHPFSPYNLFPVSSTSKGHADKHTPYTPSMLGHKYLPLFLLIASICCSLVLAQAQAGRTGYDRGLIGWGCYNIRPASASQYQVANAASPQACAVSTLVVALYMSSPCMSCMSCMSCQHIRFIH
jgi:hypothetical protein